GEAADRQDKLLAGARDYLPRLRDAEAAFHEWLAQLKQIAGSHAGNIPAPPAFPNPPADLEQMLNQDHDIRPDTAQLKARLADALRPPEVRIDLPPLKMPTVAIPPAPDGRVPIPGTLGIIHRDPAGN